MICDTFAIRDAMNASDRGVEAMDLRKMGGYRAVALAVCSCRSLHLSKSQSVSAL